MRMAPRVQASGAAPGSEGPAAAGQGYDWTVAILGAVFAGGVYLDGWAHTHHHVDQSFFTPWHAVLYGGYLVLAAFLAAGAVGGRRRGPALRSCMPPGYELSLLGAAVFAAGGVADLVWHILFGIESSVDALFSPTHLILAVGGVLMAGGPLRSAFRRADRAAVMPWPAVVSMAVVLCVFTFFMQIASPVAHTLAAGRRSGAIYDFTSEALGVTSVAVTSAMVVALVLVAARRFVLPWGAFTLVLGVDTLAVGFLGSIVVGLDGGLRLVPGALVAGLLADVLYGWLRSGPLAGRPAGLRVWAAGVPMLYFLLYFLTLQFTTGIAWSIHLWLGSVALAGIVGWLLSYVVAAPLGPASEMTAPAWR